MLNIVSQEKIEECLRKNVEGDILYVGPVIPGYTEWDRQRDRESSQSKESNN